jgi:Fe-S cluster assembly ATP-binding protein
MLTIKNLHAEVEDKKILKGINLHIRPGEVHAIMGPNGSGKSSLASVLAGRENFVVTEGDVNFDGKDLLDMAPEDRAREGLFLAFQYPVEIPGVSNINFLRTALNEIRSYRKLPALDAKEFLRLSREKQKLVEFDAKLVNRSLNEGFSGGEKKEKRDFSISHAGAEVLYFG